MKNVLVLTAAFLLLSGCIQVPSYGQVRVHPIWHDWNW